MLVQRRCSIGLLLMCCSGSFPMTPPPPLLGAPSAPSVIIVGGSSGMGKGLAKVVVECGGRVLLASRSAEKLERARREVLACAPQADEAQEQICETVVLDAADEDAVAAFAATLEPGKWSGLAVSAAGKAPHGPVTALPTADTRSMMESKFWTAYHSLKHVSPLLADGGAVALVGGVLNRRPGVNCAPLACVNGALEGLARSAALDLAPRLRVNCELIKQNIINQPQQINYSRRLCSSFTHPTNRPTDRLIESGLSPGFCDTERFDAMDGDRKQAMFDNTAASLPLRRVGAARDMGEALLYLLTAPFVTGVVLDCDGGHHIRQYANAADDPMRKKGTSGGGGGGGGGETSNNNINNISAKSPRPEETPKAQNNNNNADGDADADANDNSNVNDKNSNNNKNNNQRLSRRGAAFEGIEFDPNPRHATLLEADLPAPVVSGPPEERGRIIFVGDVHGCFDELEELLAATKWDRAKDSIVLLGDLVNKVRIDSEQSPRPSTWSSSCVVVVAAAAPRHALSID